MKKTLTKEDFVSAMFMIANKVSDEFCEYVKKKIETPLDDNSSGFECDILSLWMVCHCIRDPKILDALHNQYFNEIPDEKTRGIVSEIINKRYEQYYEVYKDWQEDNPNTMLMFGSVVMNVFKGEADTEKLHLDIVDVSEVGHMLQEGIMTVLDYRNWLVKEFDTSGVTKFFKQV